MPIYEYECTKCGKHEEVIQKFSDKPLKKCRHCSGKLNKLISQSSFHLKGSGWYVTDYADNKRSTSSASEKSDTTTKDSTKKTEKTTTKTSAKSDE